MAQAGRPSRPQTPITELAVRGSGMYTRIGATLGFVVGGVLGLPAFFVGMGSIWPELGEDYSLFLFGCPAASTSGIHHWNNSRNARWRTHRPKEREGANRPQCHWLGVPGHRRFGCRSSVSDNMRWSLRNIVASHHTGHCGNSSRCWSLHRRLVGAPPQEASRGWVLSP